MFLNLENHGDYRKKGKKGSNETKEVMTHKTTTTIKNKGEGKGTVNNILAAQL